MNQSGIETIGVNTAVEVFQNGNVLVQCIKIEWRECSGFRVFYHTDGTSGIDDKDIFIHILILKADGD